MNRYNFSPRKPIDFTIKVGSRVKYSHFGISKVGDGYDDLRGEVIAFYVEPDQTNMFVVRWDEDHYMKTQDIREDHLSHETMS